MSRLQCCGQFPPALRQLPATCLDWCQSSKGEATSAGTPLPRTFHGMKGRGTPWFQRKAVTAWLLGRYSGRDQEETLLVLKFRPLFPTFEPCSPPKPSPNSSVFWFHLVMAKGETWLWQQVFYLNLLPKCPVHLGHKFSCSGLECCGLESGLRGGWENWPLSHLSSPCQSTKHSCQPCWLLDELHQAINGWSKVKDGKEWWWKLFSLLVFFHASNGAVWQLEIGDRVCGLPSHGRIQSSWRCLSRNSGGKRKSSDMSLIGSSRVCLSNISLTLQALPMSR